MLRRFEERFYVLQIGRVVTNFFIDALAPERHCLLFRSVGALFQAFMLSFMKVSFVTLERALEFILPAL